MPYKYLKDMLNRNKLAFLNPDEWPDKNDSLAVKRYKELKGISNLFACCFTQTAETYHHWQVYGKEEAVRVIFNKDKLLSQIVNDKRYTSGVVEYVLLKNFSNTVLSADKLPFVKRWPYRDEHEFRIIYSDDKKDVLHYLDLPDNCIEQISIGPQLDEKRFADIKAEIRMTSINVPKIYRTTILHNTRWINMINKLI